MLTVAPSICALAEEDVLRAHLYAMLEHLLALSPDSRTLAMLASLQGDDRTPLGHALTGLREAAAAVSPGAAAAEYQVLFVGLTEGELRPYASWYLTGFLYGRPLGALRSTMQRLGIARANGITEPEDHIASVCAMMSGMILGHFGTPADLSVQRAFFSAHLQPWAGQFFLDLAGAEAAPFYQTVGQLGFAFLRIEEEAMV